MEEKLLVRGGGKEKERVKPFKCSGFAGTARVCCRRRTEFLSIRTGDEELPTCGAGEVREMKRVVRWKEERKEGMGTERAGGGKRRAPQDE